MKLIGFLVILLLANDVYAATRIQMENARPGSLEWQLAQPAEYGEVEGYASLTSIQRGGQIKLFVSATEPFYIVDIYRMGWYGGMGARLIVGGIRRSGNRQPIPTLGAQCSARTL